VVERIPMDPLPSLPELDEAARARALALVERRQRPERRILGTLALGVRGDDRSLIDVAIAAALAAPEEGEPQRTRKAILLYRMTAGLVRAGYDEVALRLAPLIPFAAGMTQMLVFSVEQPQERYCWRVTPAYALTEGRTPFELPIDPLILPYQHGRVEIDDGYLRRKLLARPSDPPPILLLPHPLGLVELDGASYVILDGNHRVVCAWHRRCGSIPGFVLTQEEAAAVLLSHTQWPPYNAAVRYLRA
jgi:hypothetical protein